MGATFSTIAYLVAAVLFILALRGLSHPETSRQGNLYGMVGMAIAVVATLLRPGMDFGGVGLIVVALAIGGGVGAYIATRIQMTALPQLVAAFHSLVGMAAVFVAAAAFYAPESFGIGTRGHIHGGSLVEMSLGLAIGAVTFSGSVIAFAKLQALMSGAPITFRYQHWLNLGLGVLLVVLVASFVASGADLLFWSIAILAFALGFLLIIPIGGADMPVVVSMLNSYSGWAAAAMGFTLHNSAMIITGALVGSSGAILSYIMCRAMNRSFISVIAGGFGGDTAAAGGGEAIDRPWKRGSAEDAAFLMKQAEQVIIVPGYGMAVAQAQHALREMADKLKEEGVEVKYAIHPVAGRMPGHMNVLLAEADVPYDKLKEMDEINGEFPRCDVALIIGANDVVNPAARNDSSSPIYGMPILDVDKAHLIIVLKRSMSSGFAGIDNPLFYDEKTQMLFGDAKKSVSDLLSEVHSL